MRRTILSVMALACTAVLASTVPAFADGATPTPTPPATRTAGEPPTSAPTPVATRTPSAVKGGVAVVPKGAPDTGVAPTTAGSGVNGGLVGGGAAAALAVGGAAFIVVRRRRSAQA